MGCRTAGGGDPGWIETLFYRLRTLVIENAFWGGGWGGVARIVFRAEPSKAGDLRSESRGSLPFRTVPAATSQLVCGAENGPTP